MDAPAAIVELLAIFAAGVVAGALNAVAGGGSLLTFPVLLWVGVDPVVASATNSVAMWPGSVAAAFGFRRDIRDAGWWWVAFGLPSLLGGLAGAFVLLELPSGVFGAAAPWLVLGATALLAVRDRVGPAPGEATGAERRSTPWLALAVAAQLAIAVYGGLFGAGMGILILGALALAGLRDMHRMNGLKNALSALIKGVATFYFAFTGAVVWVVAVTLAVATTVGGLAGAAIAYRIGRERVRKVVVVVGVAMAVSLLFRVYA